MNKFLIMALFAIILVTAVTYDSFAIDYYQPDYYLDNQFSDYYPIDSINMISNQSESKFSIIQSELSIKPNHLILAYYLSETRFTFQILAFPTQDIYYDSLQSKILPLTTINYTYVGSDQADSYGPQFTNYITNQNFSGLDINDNTKILYCSFDLYDQNGDLYLENSNSPDYIPTPNEYIYITTPFEGFKTIDKFMTYNVMYKIAADQIADVKLNVRNEEGLPFGEDPDVISYNAVNHNATIENGYVTGTLQIMVDYQTTFVGPIGIQLDILNEVTNRQLSITRNVEIVAFVDADGDGIDDNTGQDQFERIEIPSLDGTDLSITNAVDTIANVIPAMNNAVKNIVSLLGVMFSWLPAQVTVLMVLIMILIAITTILKVLRG